MLIDGQMVFSRPTLTAGRTLLSATATIIVVHAYDLDLSGLELAGVSIPAERLNEPLAWTVALLFLSYAVNWITDVLSYVGWNNGERVQKQAVWGGGKAEALRSRIDNLLSSMDSTNKQISEKIEANQIETKDLETLRGLLRDSTDNLTKARRGVSRLWLTGGVFVYGWYGIVPLIATLWSLSILLCSG